MRLLDGKVAIVTGGGNGIGRAHALRLASEGARVVVNDLGGARDGSGSGTSAADAVVTEIRAAGGEAVASYDTVATMEGGRAICRAAVDAFGRVDVLVNNAGILRDKTLLNMEEAMWDAVLSVHLKGTFACTQPVARWMKDNGVRGSIINTSSISGLMGNFGQANYGAAKAAIAAFTRIAALELAKAGIRVNAVAPVAITRLTEDLSRIAIDAAALAPEHVAEVVLYLASELSGDLTGEVVGVHGNKVFVWRTLATTPLSKEPAAARWTVQELAARFAEIAAQPYLPPGQRP